MVRRNTEIIFVVFAVLWNIFIWHNSLETSVESSAQSGVILDWINSVLANIGGLELNQFLIRKAAHMFEFFVLAILWNRAFACCTADTSDISVKGQYTLPILICTVVACIDEMIQLHVPGRSGEVRDVLVDISGALLGIALIYIINRLRKRKIYN